MACMPWMCLRHVNTWHAFAEHHMTHTAPCFHNPRPQLRERTVDLTNTRAAAAKAEEEVARLKTLHSQVRFGRSRSVASGHMSCACAFMRGRWPLWSAEAAAAHSAWACSGPVYTQQRSQRRLGVIITAVPASPGQGRAAGRIQPEPGAIQADPGAGVAVLRATEQPGGGRGAVPRPGRRARRAEALQPADQGAAGHGAGAGGAAARRVGQRQGRCACRVYQLHSNRPAKSACLEAAAGPQVRALPLSSGCPVNVPVCCSPLPFPRVQVSELRAAREELGERVAALEKQAATLKADIEARAQRCVGGWDEAPGWIQCSSCVVVYQRVRACVHACARACARLCARVRAAACTVTAALCCPPALAAR